MKKVFEPGTDTVKDVSKDVTKLMMVLSKENWKTKKNLKEKVSDLNIDKSLKTSCLATPLVNLCKPDTKSQLKIIKHFTSKKVNSFLINENKPRAIYDKLLTFCTIQTKSLSSKEAFWKWLLITVTMLFMLTCWIANSCLKSQMNWTLN